MTSWSPTLPPSTRSAASGQPTSKQLYLAEPPPIDFHLFNQHHDYFDYGLLNDFDLPLDSLDTCALNECNNNTEYDDRDPTMRELQEIMSTSQDLPIAPYSIPQLTEAAPALATDVVPSQTMIELAATCSSIEELTSMAIGFHSHASSSILAPGMTARRNSTTPIASAPALPRILRQGDLPPNRSPASSAGDPASYSVQSGRIEKRQRNTEAARRYRQRKVDRVTDLEEALQAMTKERDELRLKLARAEAEANVLRAISGKH